MLRLLLVLVTAAAAAAQDSDLWCKQNVDEEAIETRTVLYEAANQTFEGYLAMPMSGGAKSAVLIAHDWDGVTEFEIWRAKYLASLGYISMVMDVFGAATPTGDNLPVPERPPLMEGVLGDEEYFIALVKAAKAQLDGLGSEVYNGKSAVFGYCFGGAMALQMARRGFVDYSAAFHAGMSSANNMPSGGTFGNSSTPFSLFNGFEDAYEVEPYQTLMNEAAGANVDFQVVLYADTVHAFTEPTFPEIQHNTNSPVAYSPYADQRSWNDALSAWEDIVSGKTGMDVEPELTTVDVDGSVLYHDGADQASKAVMVLASGSSPADVATIAESLIAVAKQHEVSAAVFAVDASGNGGAQNIVDAYTALKDSDAASALDFTKVIALGGDAPAAYLMTRLAYQPNALPDVKGFIGMVPADASGTVPTGDGTGCQQDRPLLIIQDYQSLDLTVTTSVMEAQTEANVRWEYMFVGGTIEVLSEKSVVSAVYFTKMLFMGDIPPVSACIDDQPRQVGMSLECALQPNEPEAEVYQCPNNCTDIVGGYIEYVYEGVSYRAFAAHPAEPNGTLDAVVIYPDWDGISEYEVWRAQKLADEGYLALVITGYDRSMPSGDDLPIEDRIERQGMLLEDLDMWHGIMQSGVDILDSDMFADVYSGQFAAIGYCFGGTAVLQMARQATEEGPYNFTGIVGVVGNHVGQPEAPELANSTLTPFEEDVNDDKQYANMPRVVIYNGLNDTSVTWEQHLEFMQEAERGMFPPPEEAPEDPPATIDWELHLISHTRHAFTLPSLPSAPHTQGNAVYNPYAEMRSWQGTLSFLEEIFGPENVDDLPRNDSIWDYNVSDAVETTSVEVECGDEGRPNTRCEINIAFIPDAEPKPVVLIVPDWDGVGEYEIWRAEQLASMGYLGVVVDPYGLGVEQPVASIEQRINLTSYYLGNAQRIRNKLDAAKRAALEMTPDGVTADPSNIAAIGYCFGGSAVQDYFRYSPEGLRGVATFHAGTLSPLPGSSEFQPESIDDSCPRRIVVHQGAQDPAVPLDELQSFLDEMDSAGTYYEAIFYGGAQHGWTVPDPTAEDNGERHFGGRYDAVADSRSWESLKVFLEEVFTCSTTRGDGPAAEGGSSTTDATSKAAATQVFGMVAICMLAIAALL